MNKSAKKGILQIIEILTKIKKYTKLIICFYLKYIIYRKRNEIYKEKKYRRSIQLVKEERMIR